MGMPAVLKNFAVFVDGVSYAGEVTEITPPKLTRKLEEYRAGGMNMGAKVDQGMEALEAELTAGGWLKELIAQFGKPGASTVPVRFVGAVQRDDTGEYSSVEMYMRGRWEEVDMGSGKAGDNTEFKAKLALTYYRLVWDGEEICEVDAINMIERFGGVDNLAEVRRILGT